MAPSGKQDEPYRRRNRRPRLDPYVYGRSGYAIHVNITTHDRIAFFQDNDDLARTVISALHETAQFKGVVLLCYCLMPDHLHFVVRVEREDTNLFGFVWSFKNWVGRKTAVLMSAPLWQDSFYDHVIRGYEGIRRTCLYVVENPVRKGIVEDWRQYPYSWLSNEY